MPWLVQALWEQAEGAVSWRCPFWAFFVLHPEEVQVMMVIPICTASGVSSQLVPPLWPPSCYCLSHSSLWDSGDVFCPDGPHELFLWGMWGVQQRTVEWAELTVPCFALSSCSCTAVFLQALWGAVLAALPGGAVDRGCRGPEPRRVVGAAFFCEEAGGAGAAGGHVHHPAGPGRAGMGEGLQWETAGPSGGAGFLSALALAITRSAGSVVSL